MEIISAVDFCTLDRFSTNMSILRKIAGWSQETLAWALGLSRSSVQRMENERGHMSIIQYLAVRALVEREVKNGNWLLEEALAVLVDMNPRDMAYESKIVSCIQQAERRTSKKFGVKALQNTIMETMPSIIFKEGK